MVGLNFNPNQNPETVECVQLGHRNMLGPNFEKLFYSALLFLSCSHCMRGAGRGSMRKSVVFFFVFLMLASLGLVLVPQVSSQPENVKVLSYSGYLDSLGDFVVAGEVQNVGPNTIASVVLSGTVYSKDGEAQAKSYTQAFVNYLVPQQKAPFSMEFLPVSAADDLSWLSLGFDRVDFSVNVAEATSSYQYPDLTVKSSSGGVDAEGACWVSGTIQNSGTQTATNVRVIGTFYNASGTVVAVGYSDLLTPASLAPSSIASFKVGAFDLNQTEAPSNLIISSFLLLIQTEEPILSGTAPSPPPSSPQSITPPSDSTPSSPPSITPPSDSTPSSTESPSSENPNVLTPEAIYAIVVVIVILGLAGTMLMLRKRKSQAKSQAIRRGKSQARKKQK